MEKEKIRNLFNENLSKSNFSSQYQQNIKEIKISIQKIQFETNNNNESELLLQNLPPEVCSLAINIMNMQSSDEQKNINSDDNQDESASLDESLRKLENFQSRRSSSNMSISCIECGSIFDGPDSIAIHAEQTGHSKFINSSSMSNGNNNNNNNNNHDNDNNKNSNSFVNNNDDNNSISVIETEYEFEKLVLIQEISRLEKLLAEKTEQTEQQSKSLYAANRRIESLRQLAESAKAESSQMKEQLIATRVEYEQILSQRDSLAKNIKSAEKTEFLLGISSQDILSETKRLGEQLKKTELELSQAKHDREQLAKELGATRDYFNGNKTWKDERRGFRPFSKLLNSSTIKKSSIPTGFSLFQVSPQAHSAAQTALEVLWVKEILPKWEERKNSKDVKALWYRGIPSAIRGRVWSLSLKNPFHITEDLYIILAETSKHFVRDVSNATIQAYGEQDTVNLIVSDIGRTFPSMKLFGKGFPLHDSLIKVLCAFVMYRPDLGYIQGMSYLAAFLLIFMDDFSAFVCFVSLINSPSFHLLYHIDESKVKLIFEVFDILFKETLPELYDHFKKVNISSEMYLLDWFLTLYSRALPTETAARVWDLYMLYGDVVLFRVAFAILKELFPNPQNFGFDDILITLRNVYDKIESESLFTTISSIELNSSQITKLLQKYIDDQS